MKLDYWSNHSNRPAYTSMIGKDIKMHRITKRAKREIAQTDPMYRQKLICKMKNNFLALIAVHHEGLYQEWVPKKKGEEELWGAFVSALRTSQETLHQWTHLDPNMSLWDVVLLEWSCLFGEDLTHQATTCHVDGKGPETYSLFGKIADNETSSDKELVDEMTPGLLVFPRQGMFVRVRCGRDSITMSLKRTLHLGDSTRGRRNFSSIDWSRGK